MLLALVDTHVLRDTPIYCALCFCHRKRLFDKPSCARSSALLMTHTLPRDLRHTDHIPHQTAAVADFFSSWASATYACLVVSCALLPLSAYHLCVKGVPLCATMLYTLPCLSAYCLLCPKGTLLRA